MATVAAWIAHALRIQQLPIADWRAAVAEIPESEQEPVRAYLMGVIEMRKRDAALAARVESGQDAVLVLKANGVKEARWA